MKKILLIIAIISVSFIATEIKAQVFVNVQLGCVRSVYGRQYCNHYEPSVVYYGKPRGYYCEPRRGFRREERREMYRRY